MTREEIVAMAREAGLENYGPTPSAPYSYGIFVDCMERFATLTAQRAAAEREACEKRCERVADDYIADNGRHAAAIAYECAVAIRATGEKP